MDWKFEKNMYPILDTRVECKVNMDESLISVIALEYNQNGM